MEEDERKAYELFSQKQGLVNQEPTFTAAFSAPLDKLTEGRQRARALYAEGPTLLFDDQQRRDIGGQRYPELQGVATLFARVLTSHPQIEKDCPARPPLLDRTVRLD